MSKADPVDIYDEVAVTIVGEIEDSGEE